MNKSALKRFATGMRVELMGIVKNRLDYLLSLDSTNLPIEYKARAKSIDQIRARCFKEGNPDKEKKEEFIEEVAYTWFNRLIALRFMDMNQISDTMTISPLANQTIPQIMGDAKAGTIPGDLAIDTAKFYNLIDKKISAKDPDNEAYKMLFIAVCNHHYDAMPFMFEKISDYTELLLPDDLLSPNSVRAKVIDAMPEEDCKDIEIIGWLYQFYISEKKDSVFEALKNNKKITPGNIPAATQLFTPHWIVKYMVENSLGKLWMQNRPSSKLKEQMKYYIESDEQNDFIKVATPEELTLLDPCCGSGHVLTYGFDLLTKIYEEEGYSASEISGLILEKNLYGCDIDKRAATLAQFALMMKARQYHKRFFRKKIRPNVVELQEFGSDAFRDIKNFGSLMKEDSKESFVEGIFAQSTNKEYLLQSRILSGTFHCVVTNPPYMGGKGMNKELSDYVKSRYPDSKSDLFAVFIERGFELTKAHGFMAMITMQSWMFLSSYEKLRYQLLENYSITTMAHLDNMVMGIAFGTAATVFCKQKPNASTEAVYFKINLDDLDDNREIKGLK